MKIVLVGVFSSLTLLGWSAWGAESRKPRSTRVYDSQAIVDLFQIYKNFNESLEAEWQNPILDDEAVELHLLKPRLIVSNDAELVEALKLINDPDYARRKWEQIRKLDPESYYIHLTTQRNDEAFWMGLEDGGRMEGVGKASALSAEQILDGLQSLKNLLVKLRNGSSP